jgi:quinol-cytochrome oxidoreductase complex cytochrome b subunit
LNRFFSLHYLLPFGIAGMAIVHLSLLHYNSSNNPLGCPSNMDKIPMYPFFIVKDLFSLLIFLLAFSGFIFFSPNSLGHPDNYIEANAMVTPPHIVPEWYFLPFYAILRAVPDKLLGVVAMGASIAIFFFIPFISQAELRSSKFRYISKALFWAFVADVFLLGYLGGQLAEEPFITISQVASIYYFLHFIILINLAYFLEKRFSVAL